MKLNCGKKLGMVALVDTIYSSDLEPAEPERETVYDTRSSLQNLKREWVLYLEQ